MATQFNESPTTRQPITLAADETLVIDCRGCTLLRVKEGAGATATVTEVDSVSASAAGTTDVSTDATSATGLTVAWPYYHVSVTGGACVVVAMV